MSDKDFPDFGAMMSQQLNAANSALQKHTVISGESLKSIQLRQETLAGRHDAAEIFQHLIQRLKEFQASLGPNQEVGIQLANFGLAAQLHIRSIAYKNPNLIEFIGIFAQDQEAVLIQHITQLNFMLIAVKPFEEKPYRIGFR